MHSFEREPVLKKPEGPNFGVLCVLHRPKLRLWVAADKGSGHDMFMTFSLGVAQELALPLGRQG
jgi:hypothetical protein